MNILLLAFALFATIPAFANNFKIIHFKGKISVERDAKRLNPQKNFILHENDKIITAKKSIAIVKNDLMTIKVIENSSLRISDLRKEINVDIKQGGAVINFVKNEVNKRLKKDLKVITSHSAVGVRGTTFFIYNFKDETSFLTVKDGEVDFSGTKNKGLRRVGNGKSSFINNDLESEPPHKVGFEENINWEIQNFNSDLSQPKALFSKMEKQWSDYKKEMENKWNDNNKQMNDQWKKVQNEL